MYKIRGKLAPYSAEILSAMGEGIKFWAVKKSMSIQQYIGYLKNIAANKSHFIRMFGTLGA